jgi:hypothetical protein
VTDLRDQVRAQVAGLARPDLVGRDDLLAWVDELPPAGYARVAQIVLGSSPRRAAPTGRVEPYPSIGQQCGVRHG